MLRVVGRGDHHLARDLAVQVECYVLFEAVAGFGTALAAVTPVGVRNGDAAVGSHARRDAPRAQPSPCLQAGAMLFASRHSYPSHLPTKVGRWSRHAGVAGCEGATLIAPVTNVATASRPVLSRPAQHAGAWAVTFRRRGGSVMLSLVYAATLCKKISKRNLCRLALVLLSPGIGFAIGIDR